MSDNILEVSWHYIVLFCPKSTSTLEKGEIVTFTSSTVKREGLLNTHYWTEKNERSTSKTYTLWEEADVHLVEWPGQLSAQD